MKINTALLSIVSLIFLYNCSISNNDTSNPKMENKLPKNIILMIGDGMGLSQISAAMYANNGTLYMEEAEYIGLIKTNSADDLITDSAAGATAFATGEKTYNGSINMNTDTLPLTPITSLLIKNKIKTGIVSTSSVTHATPACFYGNQTNRYGVNEALAKQFINSKIDVLIGGGEDYFTQRKDKQNLLDSLKNDNYVIIDSIIDDIPIQTEKLINFCAPKEPNTVKNGRNNFLSLAAEKAMHVLNNNNNNGFFLMIEGSQIDWGGHDNDSDYIISETLDFDKAIKTVLDFAKKDQNTLVIITADHETGGYGITGQNKKTKKLETSFLNTDHTATMVPLFAFGPGAKNYIGTYHNNELHTKILESFSIQKTGF